MENTTENNNTQAEESNKKVKRSADKQLTSDDAQNDSEEETEKGQDETWKPADEQTVSQRRKVKVRRGQSTSLEPTSEPQPAPTPAAPAWPKFDFGGLTTPAFPTPTASSSTPEKKPEDKPKEGSPAPQFKFDIPATNFTFQPVSFSPSFSFQPAPPSGAPGAPIFGFNIAPPKAPANKDEEDAEGNEIPEGEADSFYNPNAKQEQEAKDAEAAIQGSGEEDENHAFQCKSKLFVLEGGQWKERGVGYIRVNVAKDESFARLIMRTDVSRRVILNFRLWPTILMDKIADKQVRVVGPSADKPKELCSYLVRFGKPESASDFMNAVLKHKGTGHSTTSNNNTTEKSEDTKKTETEKQPEKPETTAEK
mmetsp:Transcript_5667/g.7930  ORF Transcript_5667/g.7930 Transcript_5667/m.7930 type:complete len:366 (+) Transcript_5667:41-1138(+)